MLEQEEKADAFGPLKAFDAGFLALLCLWLKKTNSKFDNPLTLRCTSSGRCRSYKRSAAEKSRALSWLYYFPISIVL